MTDGMAPEDDRETREQAKRDAVALVTAYEMRKQPDFIDLAEAALGKFHILTALVGLAHSMAQEVAELRGIPREQMLRELEILELNPFNLQDPDPVYRALLQEEVEAKFDDDEKSR